MNSCLWHFNIFITVFIDKPCCDSESSWGIALTCASQPSRGKTGQAYPSRISHGTGTNMFSFPQMVFLSNIAHVDPCLSIFWGSIGHVKFWGSNPVRYISSTKLRQNLKSRSFRKLPWLSFEMGLDQRPLFPKQLRHPTGDPPEGWWFADGSKLANNPRARTAAAQLLKSSRFTWWADLIGRAGTMSIVMCCHRVASYLGTLMWLSDTLTMVCNVCFNQYKSDD